MPVTSLFILLAGGTAPDCEAGCISALPPKERTTVVNLLLSIAMSIVFVHPVLK